eukprot:180812_1
MPEKLSKAEAADQQKDIPSPTFETGTEKLYDESAIQREKEGKTEKKKEKDTEYHMDPYAFVLNGKVREARATYQDLSGRPAKMEEIEVRGTLDTYCPREKLVDRLNQVTVDGRNSRGLIIQGARRTDAVEKKVDFLMSNVSTTSGT